MHMSVLILILQPTFFCSVYGKEYPSIINNKLKHQVGDNATSMFNLSSRSLGQSMFGVDRNRPYDISSPGQSGSYGNQNGHNIEPQLGSSPLGRFNAHPLGNNVGMGDPSVNDQSLRGVGSDHRYTSSVGQGYPLNSGLMLQSASKDKQFGYEQGKSGSFGVLVNVDQSAARRDGVAGLRLDPLSSRPASTNVGPNPRCNVNGRVLFVGDKWSTPGICGIFICDMNQRRLLTTPCPQFTFHEESGCSVEAQDLSQDFPYCCPKLECSNKNTNPTTTSKYSSLF